MFDHVGPVFESGNLTRELVRVLKALNPGLQVVDEGSYVRVLAKSRCVLDLRVVEKMIGRPFRFPQDLESIMPSFKGRLIFKDDNTVEWVL